MGIGKNIASLRKQSNLTQEQLATKLGVSPQAISKWENETSCPDITLLTQIADCFNVTVDELLRNDENEILVISENNKSIPNDNAKIESSKFSKIVITIDSNSPFKKPVTVNVPLSLVKAGLNIGNSFGLDKAISSKIYEIISNGNLDEIVSVNTEQGETVTIKIQ